MVSAPVAVRVAAPAKRASFAAGKAVSAKAPMVKVARVRSATVCQVSPNAVLVSPPPAALLFQSCIWSERACLVVEQAANAAAAPKSTVSEELVMKSINSIRFLAIDGVEKANSGHPGLPMGCAPMTYVLFREFMRFNPKNPQWVNRDRFVLSAGHGSMLHYSMLHLCGYDSVQARACPSQRLRMPSLLRLCARMAPWRSAFAPRRLYTD